MALFTIENITLSGLAVSVPANTESNFDLVNLNDKEKQTLVDTTGIENRRIANSSTTAADLCIKAAEKVLNGTNIDRNDIEVLVFVTQTPDYTIPGTSMFIQHQLGLTNHCLAIDINQGCAGYVYGLSVIGSLMSSGKFKKGLLLVGDTITKTIAEDDFALRPVFSDAGSCTLLAYDTAAKPMYFNLQTNGNGYDKIIVKGGGARVIANSSNCHLYMNGQDIFNFGLKEVAANIDALFMHFGLGKDEIDYFVMHQANKLLNEAIRKKAGMNASNTLYSLKEYGNTSCASIPVTMAMHASGSDKMQHKNFLLAGFGVGLSWGSMVMSTQQFNCFGIDEYN